MSIGNCDCCPRRDVPGSVVTVPGEPFACFICQGDVVDPYCELDDGLDSEGYPLNAPREWSDDELRELRRRDRASDNYGSM